jgi:fatty-acyl-CoA synthase
LTAEAIRDGWSHTGDLGPADADGFITLVDRKKDMIITGGENVYPIEAERVLQRHPAVEDCAVIGVGDSRWGEIVLAVVVTRDGAGADAAELIDYTRGLIAHFKCPTWVEFVGTLPRKATGKLLKRSLSKQLPGATTAASR